jgi:hypothetical protein
VADRSVIRKRAGMRIDPADRLLLTLFETTIDH